MTVQWYALVDNATGQTVAFVSNDAQGFSSLPGAGRQLVAVDHQPTGDETYDPVTHVITGRGPNAIAPPVTRSQASAILKALLENPPTAQSPWTALQQQQALYLVLLAEFKDFKNGTVY